MKKNNQSGFTLVELMVVVGIIGILIALVAPNLTSFTAKAKQSQAKVELSGLYTAEKSFQAEYNTYHGSLPYIGHIPDGCLNDGTCNAAAKRTYTVGFTAQGVLTDVVAGVTGNFTGTGAGVKLYQNTVGAAITSPTTSGTLNQSQSTFTAGAKGIIRSATADEWTINENKILLNAVPGI